MLRGSESFDRATPITSVSEGSFQLDWQLPRAPVRFPLRDALLSFQDTTRVPSVQEAGAGSSTQSSKGPLVVQMTEKARLRKYLSHRKRFDLDPPALGEFHASPMPRPPPEITGRIPARKAMNSYGTEGRAQARRNAEDAGWSTWMPQPVEGKDSSPDANASSQAIARPTLTSSARAVLSHSRRFAAESLADGGGGGHAASTHGSSAGMGKASGSMKKCASDPTLAWSPSRQTKGLPRPVKEWVCRGLEFTDAGLGIGERFDGEINDLAGRAPGHIYTQDWGEISRWKSEASQPSKQQCTKYASVETHKMGARRDVTRKQDRQRPGPGTYEFMGFAQELVHKLSKRPKGEAPRSLSPPGSTKGSKMLQASGGSSHG